MRAIIIFAGMLLGFGVFTARFADQLGRAPVAPPAAALAQVPPAPAPQSSYGSNVVLQRDARGHFSAAARVDGRRMDFMVDTGASVIALRASDAAGLGIHPLPRDFSVEVKTANGSVHAAPTQLGMVEIGGVMVRDVAALVLPDQVLSENLLGMSFLSRLRRFEYGDGKLVLEQ